MKRRTQQMSRRNLPAIRNGIKKALAPVPGCMKSHREPQAPGAAQSKAKEKANHPRSQCAHPSLARILQMHRAKDNRKHHSSRPESNTSRQREQRVTARKKFLEQAH